MVISAIPRAYRDPPLNLRRTHLAPLAVEAFFFCWKYRLLLWLRPAATGNHVRPAAATRSHTTPGDVSVAVAFAARFIPAASCLPQALAAQRMLLRRGIPCRVEIGVSLDGGLAAHAWVVAGEVTVHGASTRHYHPLRPTRPQRHS
jgi:Transglutaminase-like superfamily